MLNNYLLELSQKYTIYCDLDGVLTDFKRSLKELFPKMNQLKNNKKLSDEIWKKISDAGPMFWSNMEWMSDGHELWNHIVNFKPHILSARPIKSRGIIHQHAYKGKREWIAKELGVEVLNRTHIVLRQEKQKYSNSNSILIDDKKENIKEFNKKGGIGILHITSKQSIKALIELGIK